MIVMREIVNAKQTQVHPRQPQPGVAAEALFKRALVSWPNRRLAGVTSVQLPLWGQRAHRARIWADIGHISPGKRACVYEYRVTSRVVGNPEVGKALLRLCVRIVCRISEGWVDSENCRSDLRPISRSHLHVIVILWVSVRSVCRKSPVSTYLR